MTQKTNLPIILILIIMAISAQNSLMAQVDIDIEKIREKCKDLPYEDKVRAVVARFNISTRASQAHHTFGNEMATMLTNTLQKVNCFRVLESLANMSDMTDEIDMGNSKYLDLDAAPEMGKMMGAQVIFTGEITEYYQGGSNVGVAGITFANNKARIGFILKLLNTETREVIWSESLEAEAKVPGKFTGAQIFGVNLAGGNKGRNALGDAIERGIVKGIYKLAEEMDEVRFPEVDYVDLSNTTVTILNMKKVKYADLKNLKSILQSITDVKELKRTEFSASEETGTYRIRHTGNFDDFVDNFYEAGANLFEITNLESNTFEITLK